MKSQHNLKSLFLGLISLLATVPVLGQEKIDIAVGAGFPEMVNLGFRFQLERSRLGVYGGIVPGIEDKIISVGADFYYHFGRSPNFSTRRPWYVKAGLNYSFQEETFFKYTYVILVPRIGKDFNLSSRRGISLEGGLYFVLAHSEVEIKPGGYSVWGGPWLPYIGPSFSLSVFYRL